MKHTRWLAPPLAAVVLLAGAATALAQHFGPRGRFAPPEKSYIHFQTEDSLSHILSMKLLKEELLRRLQGAKLPALQKLNVGDLDNLETLRNLQKSLGKGPQKLNLSPEDLKKFQPLLDAAGAQAGPPATRDPQGPVGQRDAPAGAPPSQPPEPMPARPDAEEVQPDAALQEQLAEWAQEMALRLEGTRLGEALGRSPAWKQGMHSLEGFLSDRAGGKFGLPGEGLFKLTEGLRLPKNLDFPLDLGGLKPPGLTLPSLPRPRLNFHLPRWTLRMPGLGGSGTFGAVGAGAAAGQATLWAALGVLLLVLLWRIAGRSPRPAQGDPAGWRLGPWPVDPARVTTRAELVRAFEHLALLRLGRDARTWNHHDIAARLGGPDAPLGQAADDLAALYEQARYAPGDEPLPPPDLDAARRTLCLLAGVATA